MSLNHVTLDDKYDLTKSRVFVTGYQALVRMTMMQHERDKRLIAGDEYPALGQVVLVVEGDVIERHS